MINNEIREMTLRFVNALHPIKIILFGSYAKNTYRDDSDYDFYIVMPDDTELNIVDATACAYRSLRSMPNRKSVDILIHTQSHFNNRKTEISIEKTVDKEGVVLFYLNFRNGTKVISQFLGKTDNYDIMDLQNKIKYRNELVQLVKKLKVEKKELEKVLKC